VKIIVKRLTESAMRDNDWRQKVSFLKDGKEFLRESDGGEPEDNTLERDLSFVFSIPSWMRQAWEAGKNGEEFIIEQKEVELEDFD